MRKLALLVGIALAKILQQPADVSAPPSSGRSVSATKRSSTRRHRCELNRRLDAVNANSVTISVGRLDWTAFPGLPTGDRG